MATISPSSYKEIVETTPSGRTLSLTGSLSTRASAKLIESLVLIDKIDGDILYVIDCPGGNYYAGMALYEALAKCRNRVVGLVNGQALSASFVTLQGCKVRLSTPESTLSIHAPEYFNMNSPIRYDSDEESYIEEMRKNFRIQHPETVRCHHQTLRVLMERSASTDEKEMVEFVNRSKVMNPPEALCKGFLDEIV